MASKMKKAFTLIESVVAIGIFSFVIVGIVGLIGAALERQRLASFETRAVLMAQQAIARVRAADSPSAVTFTRGEGNQGNKLFDTHNFTTTPDLVIGYMVDGTANAAILAPGDWEGNSVNPKQQIENNSVDNITTKSLVTLDPIGNDPNGHTLYDLIVEVSEPATLPYSVRPYKAVFKSRASFPKP
jgi:type II secretory pathway pseudopilin PulG